jgi:hypothetical protein
VYRILALGKGWHRIGYASSLRRLLAINWLIFAAGITVLSALSSITAANIWGTGLSDTSFYDAAERAGLCFNLALYGLPLALSAVTAILRPRWWRRILALGIILPLALGAVTSGRAVALLVIIAVLVPTCWGGRELAQHLSPATDRPTAWALGAALGIGFLGIVGFITGLIGLLRPLVLWPLLCGIVAVLSTSSPARARLARDLAAARRWVSRPIALTPVRILLGGLLVATTWSVILGALAPETTSDAARQRTPAALAFAHTRSLTVSDPAVSVALLPALGEITYAVILAVGPLPSAKLFELAVSGACIFLVMALGKRLGGRGAGELATFSFATMPLVMWLGQTAYLDLLTCLAALAAALFLLTPQRPDRAAAFMSGVFCGWGIAVKLHFAYVAVGLGLTLLLLALGTPGLWTARIRRMAGLITIFSTATIAVMFPPLVRSAMLTGQVPGFSLATQSYGRANGANPSVLGDLSGFGYGRDIPHLLLLPLDLTVHSLKFEWIPTPWGPFAGLLGYWPLALLPLLLLTRVNYRTAALWWGSVLALLGWFYSAQYLRYGLPIFVLLGLIGVTAFTDIRRRSTSPAFKRLLTILVLIPTFATVAIQARIPTYTQDFVFGRQSEAAYLDRYLYCCGGTAILRLLDAQPDATRAYALADSPRLYARTPIGTSLVMPGGTSSPDPSDPEAILAALDTGGYSHLIISRRYLSTAWERSRIVDDNFLRRYTILIGNGPDAYLYRIVSPQERATPIPWASGPELLANGDFEASGAADGPAHWSPLTIGTNISGPASASAAAPRYERGMAASGQAAVLVSKDEGWATTVPARPGQRYLLDAASRGGAANGNGDSGFTLRLEWRDITGQALATSTSRVPASAANYHRFSLAATAPPGTATVTVILLASDTRVWVDDVSLREAAGGVDTSNSP